MQSAAPNILPNKAKRSLSKLDADIALARKKSNLTTLMMAEWLGAAKSTYLKVEKGDPKLRWECMP